MATEATSFCRICPGGCGVVLTVEDSGKISKIRGDDRNELSAGYACFKGLQAEASHHGEARLRHPLKRMTDGSYREIPLETALDEIADRLGRIVDEHGPDAAGVFCGNGGLFNSTGQGMHRGFLQALGSKQFYSTVTIDQSAKHISFGRMGGWMAGWPAFEDMDVVLAFGTNPLISHSSLGVLTVDPVKQLKRAKARGLKMIIVDPRRTETARHADILLQPYPGEDAAIAGSILREILREGWEDRAFCERHVGRAGLDRLRGSLEKLTPEMVEAWAGLKPGQIHEVARIFAKESRTGVAIGATGTCMSPFSNMTQHLVDLLNVVCGRFLREGQPVHTANALAPLTQPRAEVIPATRPWEQGGASRTRGARNFFGERLSATLTDEILSPGPEQLRALIVDGGDLVNCLPDRRKTIEALETIELLVAIDPWPTPTARSAHYVLPPRMQYERADLSLSLPPYAFWPGVWAQYTPRIIPDPAGSELVDDWYVFWSIAKRLGRTINYDGKQALDMMTPPSCDDLLAMRLQGSLTSLQELKNFPAGKRFDLNGLSVAPPSAEHKFEVWADDVRDEFEQYCSRDRIPNGFKRDGQTFTHVLSCRRMRDIFCSVGTRIDTIRARNPFNPAYLNPDDLASLGLEPGDEVEITSAHGKVVAIVQSDPDMKSGVVSLPHGWGGLPAENEDPRAEGSCVNLLIDTDRNFEPINAMPHMTAVPINIMPRR